MTEPIKRMPIDPELQKERIAILYGPPGSGKTSYAKANRRQGDIILDLDAICAALKAEAPGHADHEDVLRTAFDIYDFLIDKIADGSLTYSRAFIITTNQSRKLQEKTGGRLIKIDPGIDRVMDQINHDPNSTPEEKRMRRDLALKYYYAHQHREKK